MPLFNSMKNNLDDLIDYYYYYIIIIIITF